MIKKLAIISGKGGSGKTSFALAIAKTLSNLKIKVLLIDCDMSTHGSTFFMKPMIEKHNTHSNKLVSVDDILLSTDMPPFGFYSKPNDRLFNNSSDGFKYENMLKVDEYMYFIPSDVSISNTKENGSKYIYETFKNCVNKEINDEFQVVIFDCQAGYSEFTRNIVSISDICLLISEPDSVSAAANKALCFQIGIELQDVHCYQMFNKITDEEAKHYSKVATSTFFTNLPPVIFNWAVRRTFLFSKIPSLETVDYEFGKSMLNILQILFPEYQNEINPIQKRINSIKKEKLEIQIEHLERKEKNEKRVQIFKYFQIVLLWVALMTLFVIFGLKIFDIKSNVELITILSFTVAILVELLLIVFRKNSSNKSNEELNALQEEFDTIQYEEYISEFSESDF